MELVTDGNLVSIHITETIYFLTILFIRSIYDIHSQVYSLELRIQRHIGIVLSVLTSWLDASLARLLYVLSDIGPTNTTLMEMGCSFYGLFAAFVFCVKAFVSVTEFFSSIKDLYD